MKCFCPSSPSGKLKTLKEQLAEYKAELKTVHPTFKISKNGKRLTNINATIAKLEREIDELKKKARKKGNDMKDDVEDEIDLDKYTVLVIPHGYYGKIFNLANGIEIYEGEKIIDQKEKLRILYLSNLVITKGVVDLVNALALFGDIDIDYQVDIIGNSADISILESCSIAFKTS